MVKETRLNGLIAGRDLAEIRSKKNGWFSIGGCCPSGGGEDDRTGLLSSTSFRLRNLPRTGSAANDEGGLETARGPRSCLIGRLLTTWWRFVVGVELPPIVFRRPVLVRVCFNLRYRLHPKGEEC
jgi:hypothetical protein